MQLSFTLFASDANHFPSNFPSFASKHRQAWIAKPTEMVLRTTVRPTFATQPLASPLSYTSELTLSFHSS